jgi:glycosyltransferase involved in cell wall biosynthesis
VKPRVVLLRGHDANPWDLGVWERLRDRYDVAALVTRSNRYDVSSLGIQRRPVRALRDLLPKGALGELGAGIVGDRYLGLDRLLEGAAIVHSAETGSWFSPAPARLKDRLGYRLVLTVWETIPLAEAYRPGRVHSRRAAVMAATDLYIAPTGRSRDALLLEGVPPERIVVSAPGIDVARFRDARAGAVDDHLIVSPGRLVWEKGHQDVIRTLAALERGLAGRPTPAPRLLITGRGPEERRLRAHADELGVGDRVEIRAVPYQEMPDVFARASCMVLASIPRAFTGPGVGELPRNYWEEQFGMVLAEAMAARLPILAAASGAIPEVTRNAVPLFPPGDWQELARLLAAGPLARPPGERVDYDEELVRSYSVEAAAERIAAAYERVLSMPGRSSSLTQRS